MKLKYIKYYYWNLKYKFDVYFSDPFNRLRWLILVIILLIIFKIIYDFYMYVPLKGKIYLLKKLIKWMNKN